jgi:hypothetical protein
VVEVQAGSGRFCLASGRPTDLSNVGHHAPASAVYLGSRWLGHYLLGSALIPECRVRAHSTHQLVPYRPRRTAPRHTSDRSLPAATSLNLTPEQGRYSSTWPLLAGALHGVLAYNGLEFSLVDWCIYPGSAWLTGALAYMGPGLAFMAGIPALHEPWLISSTSAVAYMGPCLGESAGFLACMSLNLA